MFIPNLKSSAVAGMALLAAIGLAGCSATANPPDTSLPPPVDCGADTLSGRTGQPVVGSTAQDVRVGGLPIAVPGSLRVIQPGQPVTQDYRMDRLNLEVDASGNLVRAYCA